jgi:predicted HNH restriction endonuclease
MLRIDAEKCTLNFRENYGDMGESYIEGHHTKPVSEIDANEHTKVEDITLVWVN